MIHLSAFMFDNYSEAYFHAFLFACCYLLIQTPEYLPITKIEMIIANMNNMDNGFAKFTVQPKTLILFGGKMRLSFLL